MDGSEQTWQQRKTQWQGGAPVQRFQGIRVKISCLFLIQFQFNDLRQSAETKYFWVSIYEIDIKINLLISIVQWFNNNFRAQS